MTGSSKIHIPEEQISSCFDGQEKPETMRNTEAHLESCPECRHIREEMSEITSIFRQMETVEPPPYLWNRIASAFDEAVPAPAGWLARCGLALRKPLRIRAQAWALAAVLAIGAGIGTLYWSETRTERRQLAEIDLAYRILLPQDAESYNPFAPSPYINTEVNPFSRSSRNAADSPPPAGVKR